MISRLLKSAGITSLKILLLLPSLTKLCKETKAQRERLE